MEQIRLAICAARPATDEQTRTVSAHARLGNFGTSMFVFLPWIAALRCRILYMLVIQMTNVHYRYPILTAGDPNDLDHARAP